jgi:NAD(P)-dependent dehydrogenase (short-subunit alcohol dehydrogenase family)
METLDGKVAVVTGGASGIGRSIAVEHARRGADVVIADLNEARTAEVVAEIEGLGRRALGVRCDVSSDADIDALRDVAFERFGQVDVLCNNAGCAVLGPPHRVEIADWEWILQVNVLGLVRGVRAFAPAMLERGSGHIVNTASVAGIWAYSWDATPYITSKFAAYGFSESCARVFKPQGVGVSVLCPGLITTNLGEHARSSGVPTEFAGEWLWFPPEMLDAKDADVVGPMVCDAIEADRFVIFTHDHDDERFRTWRVDIEQSLADAIASQAPVPRIP